MNMSVTKRLVGWTIGAVTVIASAASASAGAYQDAVLALEPSYYYELNETDPDGPIRDTIGNAPDGVLNGDYSGGGPQVGIPGPDFLILDGAWSEDGVGPDGWDPNLIGIQVPITGLGEENLAHFSNNAGHIDIGESDLFGAPTMSVAMFARGGGNAQGGDRLFTNNLADNTRSFQINVGNDGILVSLDPNVECDENVCAHRSLFFPGQGGDGFSNSGADRGLIPEENGWWHIVATTEGNTRDERVENIRLWLNGVERTADMKPGTVGWGRDGDIAKIGGRRTDPTDTTTHSGAQDEVAIWLGKALTSAEVETLFNAAVNPQPTLNCDFNASATCDVDDIDLLMTEVAAGTNDANFDLNNDNVVDDGDRDAWLGQAGAENGLAGPYLVGDSDLNRTVDAGDLNNLALVWLTDNALWSSGNFTGAETNVQDLNAMALNWQQSVAAASASGSAVPEPSSVLMAMCGLFGLFCQRKAKGQRSFR